MRAPVIVCSWINLQYYGSTVDHRLFGTGDKTRHNVVGTFGVLEGTGGSLRAGLPLQAVHDGTQWRHEPVRLNVVVAASPESISEVLSANAPARDLFENGWLPLFALEKPLGKVWRYSGGAKWTLFLEGA